MHIHMCWTNLVQAGVYTKCNNVCWPDPSIAIQNTKCTSTCVDLPPHAIEDTKCISTSQKIRHNMCWRYSFYANDDTNVSQPALSMRLIFQRGHKKYLNLYSPNPLNDSEDTKYIHQRHSMPAKTQNAPQHGLTKPIACQSVHKM